MKRFLSFVLCLTLAVCAAPAALAEEVDGISYNVTFNSSKEMTETYNDVGADGQGTAYDVLSQEMQPGDTATITMKIKNQYGESTDWYMSNKVIQSLEESTYQGVDNTVAEGGAYTYHLEYFGPGGSANSRVLYDSERVGGEQTSTSEETNPGEQTNPSGQEPTTGQETDQRVGNAHNTNAPREDSEREGLELATDGLEDWLYLDSLNANQEGTLVLRVALDGESQGNDYQDTLAKLIMRFAVELTPQTTTERHIQHERLITTELHYAPVKTGDESKLLLWSLVMLGCGIAALVLAAANHRRDRRERR